MIFEVLWPFLSLSSAIYFPKVTWRVELYLSFKKYPRIFSLTRYSFLFSNLILCIDIFPWCLHFFCYYSVALDCIVYISLCFCANISVESTPSSDQSLYIVKILIMTPNCPPKSLSEFALPQAVFCIGCYHSSMKHMLFKNSCLEMSWPITFLLPSFLSFSFLFVFLSSFSPSFLFPCLLFHPSSHQYVLGGSSTVDSAVTALNGPVFLWGDENGFHACLPRPQRRVCRHSTVFESSGHNRNTCISCVKRNGRDWRYLAGRRKKSLVWDWVSSLSRILKGLPQAGISVLCTTKRSQTKAGKLQGQVLMLSLMKNFVNAFDLLTSPSCSVNVLFHASGKKNLQE